MGFLRDPPGRRKVIETIRIFSERFKLNREAFNREYTLKVPENAHFKNARVMSTKKDLAVA